MILSGRGISKGEAEGTVVKVDKAVSFLGDADPNSGDVFGEKNITDSIFVFPGGRGSTVGSYVIYQLKKNGTAPRGMINNRSETIVASGSIISNIPLVDDVDIGLLKEGDEVKLDGEEGTVEIKGVEEVDVVTAFLEKNGSILLLKRGEDVGSYRGKWSGVSGYLDVENPLEQAEIEIKEETGLEAEVISEGDTIRERYEDKVWKIHPFLFVVEGSPRLNWENEKFEWVDPEDIKDMDSVPKLWEAYKSARCEDENKDR